MFLACADSWHNPRSCRGAPIFTLCLTIDWHKFLEQAPLRRHNRKLVPFRCRAWPRTAPAPSGTTLSTRSEAPPHSSQSTPERMVQGPGASHISERCDCAKKHPYLSISTSVDEWSTGWSTQDPFAVYGLVHPGTAPFSSCTQPKGHRHGDHEKYDADRAGFAAHRRCRAQPARRRLGGARGPPRRSPTRRVARTAVQAGRGATESGDPSCRSASTKKSKTDLAIDEAIEKLVADAPP